MTNGRECQNHQSVAIEHRCAHRTNRVAIEIGKLLGSSDNRNTFRSHLDKLSRLA
jgi:hypothetical protein